MWEGPHWPPWPSNLLFCCRILARSQNMPFPGWGVTGENISSWLEGLFESSWSYRRSSPACIWWYPGLISCIGSISFSTEPYTAFSALPQPKYSTNRWEDKFFDIFSQIQCIESASIKLWPDSKNFWAMVSRVGLLATWCNNAVDTNYFYFALHMYQNTVKHALSRAADNSETQ